MPEAAALKRALDLLVGIPLIHLLPKGRAPDPSVRPQRILVIKLAAVGDTLLLFPVLHALRDAYPNAEIDWLVSPVNVALARTVPYVQHFFELPSFSPFSILGMIRTLRARHYDVVIDFEQWARGTAWLTQSLGASVTAGFETPGQHRHAGYSVTLRKSFQRHELSDFIALAQRVLTVRSPTSLEIFESAQGTQELARVVPELLGQRGAPRILLHPGCGADGFPREWPLDRFAELGRWLQSDHQATLYLSGGPEEREKTGALTRSFNGQAIDLAGKLSWQGLVSAVARMDLVISGNTGVMHVAAALQRPQVVLQGPTDATIWGPLNERAILVKSTCPGCPCLRLGFEYHRRDGFCMRHISIDAVKEAVRAAFVDRPSQMS